MATPYRAKSERPEKGCLFSNFVMEVHSRNVLSSDWVLITRYYLLHIVVILAMHKIAIHVPVFSTLYK